MTGEDLFFNGVAMDNRTIPDDNTTMYSMDNATAWEISNETDNKWNMSLSGRDIYEMANELNEDVKVTTAPLHEIALELVKDGNSTSTIGSNLSVKAGIAQADSDGGDVFSFTMAVIFLLVLSFFTGRWFYESRTHFRDAILAFRGIKPINEEEEEEDEQLEDEEDLYQSINEVEPEIVVDVENPNSGPSITQSSNVSVNSTRERLSEMPVKQDSCTLPDAKVVQLVDQNVKGKMSIKPTKSALVKNVPC